MASASGTNRKLIAVAYLIGITIYGGMTLAVVEYASSKVVSAVTRSVLAAQIVRVPLHIQPKGAPFSLIAERTRARNSVGRIMLPERPFIKAPSEPMLNSPGGH